MRKSHQDRLLAQSVHNATLPEFLRSVHVPKTMVNRTFDSLSLSKVLSLSETASCNLHQTHWYHTVLCCQDTRGKHCKLLRYCTRSEAANAELGRHGATSTFSAGNMSSRLRLCSLTSSRVRDPGPTGSSSRLCPPQMPFLGLGMN